MSYQTFLTVWLIIQMVVSICRQPKVCKLEGKNDYQLIGALAGATMKYLGMFFCLYMGGFYE